MRNNTVNSGFIYARSCDVAEREHLRVVGMVTSSGVVGFLRKVPNSSKQAAVCALKTQEKRNTF